MKSVHSRVSRSVRALLFATIFLVVALVTADQYGIGWDNPAHYRAGRLTLEYVLGISNELLTFSDVRFVSPLTDLLSFLGYCVFHELSGLLPEYTARHFHLFVFGASTVGLTAFVGEESDLTNGLVAGILLGTYPVFVGFSHLAMKGIPAAFFFLLGYFAIYRWFVTDRVGYLYLMASALGFGLASKFVVTMIVPLFMIFLGIKLWRAQTFLSRTIMIHGWGLIGTFWASAILVWPYLWFNPFRIVFVFQYYLTKFSWPGPVLFMGERYIVSEGTIPFYYEAVMLAVKSPFLHLSGAGIFVGVFLSQLISREEQDAYDGWLIIGLVVPLTILLAAGGGNYDATRQMLFWYPVFCLVAARGWSWFINRKKYVGGLLFCGLLLYLAVHVYRIHPNEVVFYNGFVGREQGAAGQYELDYYGNSYRQAAEWLNKNLPEGAVVHVPRQANLLRPFVRRDLKISEKTSNDADWALVLRRYGRNPYDDQKPSVVLPSPNLPLLYGYELTK